MSGARYIAVEGPIGAGATSLARGLADKVHGTLVLDRIEENVYLERFYDDPDRYALAAQMNFLRLRSEQQNTLSALKGKSVVADYLFARDEMFARLTLAEEDFDLYRYFADRVNPAPRPDLVIYLQADPQTLRHRLAARGRAYEQDVSDAYLTEVVQAYTSFFFHYKDTPLLVINTNGIDFVNNDQDLDDVVAEVERSRSGTRYYTIQHGERRD